MQGDRDFVQPRVKSIFGSLYQMSSSCSLPASASFARLASHVPTDAAALQADLKKSLPAAIETQQIATQQWLSAFDPTGTDAQTLQGCMINVATADLSCQHADQAAQQCSAGGDIASAPIQPTTPTFGPSTQRTAPTDTHLRSPFSPEGPDDLSPHSSGAWGHAQGPSGTPPFAPTHTPSPAISSPLTPAAAAASQQDPQNSRRPPKVPLFHESPLDQFSTAAAAAQRGPIHANDAPHVADGASDQPDSETAVGSPSTTRTSSNFTELAKLAAGVFDAPGDEQQALGFDPAGLDGMADLHKNLAGQAKPSGSTDTGPAAVPMQQSQPSKRSLSTAQQQQQSQAHVASGGTATSIAAAPMQQSQSSRMTSVQQQPQAHPDAASDLMSAATGQAAGHAALQDSGQTYHRASATAGSAVRSGDMLPATGQQHQPALQAPQLTSSGGLTQQVSSVTSRELEQGLSAGQFPEGAQTAVRQPRTARHRPRRATASMRTASRHAAVQQRQLQQTESSSGVVTPDYAALASGLFGSRASLSGRQAGSAQMHKAAQHSLPTPQAPLSPILATPDPAEWGSAQQHWLPDDLTAAVWQSPMQGRVPDSVAASHGGAPCEGAGLDSEAVEHAADLQPSKANRGGVRQQAGASGRKRKSPMQEATGDAEASGN